MDPTRALAIIGGLFLVSRSLKFLQFLWLYVVRPSASFSKYGAKKGAWAVVTGASDGLGKSFAQQLAKKGFNLILVSRTQSKLDEVAKNIKEKHSVDIDVIAFDFDTTDQAKYLNLSAQILTRSPISVLVNNVGVSYDYPQYFQELPHDAITSLINVNVLSLTEMTRICLPSLVTNQRSLIVNLSSGSATVPAPLLSCYSGTKAYVLKFSQDLALEYKSKGLDLLCVNPFFVATNMAKIRRATWQVPSAARVVADTLAKAGVRTVYQPYIVHALYEALHAAVPRLFARFVFSLHKSLRARALKKMAATAAQAQDTKKTK